jgi:alkylation response protein AidB-like acyl-CoA dehydrogenase
VAEATVQRSLAGPGGRREQVQAFLAEELASARFVPRCDSWMTGFDRGFSERLAAHGWVGMTLPTEYGGQGASSSERFAVIEQLLAAGAPVAAHWFAERQIGPALLRHGTDAQKDRWLPQITAGRAVFAIGLSEPEAGSDLAAVRTRATRVEGGWLLQGTKIWSSGAHLADAIVVLARTSREERRTDGLSQFILALPNPAVLITPIRSISGEHHFNEVRFDEAFVADADVLGEIARGWPQVTAELAFERGGPERILSTMPLLTALSEAVARVEPPDLGLTEDVGGVLVELVTLREMSAAVTRQLDSGTAPVAAAALIKDLGTQFEQATVQLARRAESLLAWDGADGGRARAGYRALLDQALVQAPNFTLRGGTNEILRGIVAREITRVPPAGGRNVIAQTVAGLAEQTASSANVVKGDADAPSLDPLWPALVEAGLAGVGVAESAGGSGGDLADQLAVIGAVAATGRSIPLVEAGFVAGWLAERAGLTLAADGGLTVPLIPTGGRAARDRFEAVAWGRHASEFLVPIPGDGPFEVVRVAAADCQITPGANLAGEPRDDVVLPHDWRGTRSSDPTIAVPVAVLARAALGRAVFIAAVLREVRRLTIGYAGQRQQFGRPVAEFQAVAHHLTLIAAESDAADAIVQLALNSGDDRVQLLSGIAKSRCSVAAVRVAASAHQVHGAMGVSDEYPLGRLTKQLWSGASEHGDERHWQRQLGAVVGQAEAAHSGALWSTVLRLGSRTA